MGTGNSLAIMPFFVRDYLAATGHLSLAEHGAYLSLLFRSWEMGPLPADRIRLARLIGCSSDEFAAVWPGIEGKFAKTETGLINARLEQHRCKAIELSRKRAEAGSAGGTESAKQRGSNRQAIASANDEASEGPNVNYPNPNPNPSPDSQSPSETHPLARMPRPRLAHEGTEFHDQVIAAYHEVLPDLPAVKVWSKKRAQALNARIRERLTDGKPADTVEYWRKLFEHVAASEFLCGRSGDWRADLEWLLRPESFAKIIEGRYAPRPSANGSPAHAR